MISDRTLQDVGNNANPGVEYEIALFYVLCKECGYNLDALEEAISSRDDSLKIRKIIDDSSPTGILHKLKERNLVLKHVSLETQNDDVGPADIVMDVEAEDGSTFHLGLSVKYANSCTLNVTGRRFLSESQVKSLKEKLADYTERYICEMNETYGGISNWFRKRKPSKTTDEFIDLIRDAVIENWPNIQHKEELLSALYHSDSPMEFWVVKYSGRGYEVNTSPMSVDLSRVNDVVARKYQTSYIAFYLDDVRIGHMQVKFNNGFVEKSKKSKPDIVEQGIAISFGQPFSSWNFSVEE